MGLILFLGFVYALMLIGKGAKSLAKDALNLNI